MKNGALANFVLFLLLLGLIANLLYPVCHVSFPCMLGIVNREHLVEAVWKWLKHEYISG